MVTFWIFVALLTLLGLAFVLYPLFFSDNKRITASREEINKSIYLGKVEDLQSDLDKDLLDQEEYDQAFADLQQTLLQDTEQSEEKHMRAGSNFGMVATVVLVLPIAAILIYKQVSTDQSDAQKAQQQIASSQVQSMQSSIISLEKKLQEKPDDIEGWKMLGQSYFVLQKYQAAKLAYIKSSELANQADPDVLVLIAEASAYSNDELFGDYENSLLNRALSINPKHQRALWYSGYAAYISTDFLKASEKWGELLALVPADKPEVKDSLVKFLYDARKKAGLPVPEEPIATNSSESNVDREINVTVQLSESMNKNAQSSDTLFVYAHAVDGPKIPLSLARLTVADLPVTVSLTEEMAMMPSMNIDTFEQVQVLARISKSGQAITQPGDLISESVVIDFTKSPTAAASLSIDAIVE